MRDEGLEQHIVLDDAPGIDPDVVPLPHRSGAPNQTGGKFIVADDRASRGQGIDHLGEQAAGPHGLQDPQRLGQQLHAFRVALAPDREPALTKEVAGAAVGVVHLV